MKPTMLDGTVRIDMVNQSDLPIDMDPILHMLDADLTPTFETLTRNLKGGKVAKTQMKYSSRRREITPMKIQTTAAAAAGASQIVVDDYSFVHRDGLLYVPSTNELLLFDTNVGVAASATLDIRSLSHSTPGTAALVNAIASGATIILMGEAHAEGENVPEHWTTKSSDQDDYIMQKDRRAAEVTDIDENSANYDSIGERARQNKIAMIEYMRDIALALYLSVPAREILSASGPRRQTFGGLRYKIQTNRINMGTPPQAWTPSAVGNVFRIVTSHGGNTRNKILLVGQNAKIAMSNWPVQYFQATPEVTRWGLPNIKTVLTPWGDVDCMGDPILSEDYGLADKAAIVDTNDVNQVYMQGLPLRLLRNVSDLSTTHKTVDAITGTFGLEGRLEELHAWFDGIQAV